MEARQNTTFRRLEDGMIIAFFLDCPVDGKSGLQYSGIDTDGDAGCWPAEWLTSLPKVEAVIDKDIYPMAITEGTQANESLSLIWEIRNELRRAGFAIMASGDKLCAKADKFGAKADKLTTLALEPDKLRVAEEELNAAGAKVSHNGAELCEAGNKLWIEAIKETHGSVEIEWPWNKEKGDFDCHLEGKKTFKIDIELEMGNEKLSRHLN